MAQEGMHNISGDVYISVDDADETAAKVTSAGGKTMMGLGGRDGHRPDGRLRRPDRRRLRRLAAEVVQGCRPRERAGLVLLV